MACEEEESWSFCEESCRRITVSAALGDGCMTKNTAKHQEETMNIDLIKREKAGRHKEEHQRCLEARER